MTGNHLFLYKYNSNVNGGLNSILSDVANKLKKEDREIYILSDDTHYKKIKNVKENGFHVYYLSFANVAKLLWQKKFKSICVIEPFSKYLLMGSLFKWLRPKTDYNLYFCGSRTEFKTLLQRILLYFSKWYTKHFIACSLYARSQIFENKKNQFAKIVYCPIDSSKYIPTKGLDDAKIVSLDIVRQRKNTIDLIHAFKKIHDANKETHLMIIGSYTKIQNPNQKKDYAKKVFRLVEEYKLKESVTFYGDVSEEKKRELLSQGTIFLKTSSHEMQGISTNEALASALPVVAFDNTGTHEIVEHAGGILVPDKDAEAMASEVVALLNDRKRLKVLSKKAQKASKRYDTQNTTFKFADLLK